MRDVVGAVVSHDRFDPNAQLPQPAQRRQEGGGDDRRSSGMTSALAGRVGIVGGDVEEIEAHALAAEAHAYPSQGSQHPHQLSRARTDRNEPEREHSTNSVRIIVGVDER